AGLLGPRAAALKAPPYTCYIVCSALALAVASATARAQTPAPAPLRLTADEAVGRALATSHRIAEARARQDAAEAVVGERHAAALPQVAAQAGYTRTNHVDRFGV